MEQLPAALAERLSAFRQSEGQLVVLTGAGISAESGIPTFRGKEGYWTVGSKEYHPQEMATHAMFMRRPEEVWAWYLYRRTVCRAAEPNAGHRAVVELERLLGERFLLLTQNVDGLHLRAGHGPGAQIYEIHGNLNFARCSRECGAPRFALPEDLPPKGKGEPLLDEERAALQCSCGAWARPHVLWFDECYDEEHYRFHSSLQAAARAALLLVVGTAGATNLPMQVGQTAVAAGATIIDVNPEPNPFSLLAARTPGGFYLQGSASSYVPQLVQALAGSRE